MIESQQGELSSSISNIKFSSVYNISYRFGGERSAALIKPIGNSALPQCLCSSIFDDKEVW